MMIIAIKRPKLMDNISSTAFISLENPARMCPSNRSMTEFKRGTPGMSHRTLVDRAMSVLRLKTTAPTPAIRADMSAAQTKDGFIPSFFFSSSRLRT